MCAERQRRLKRAQNLVRHMARLAPVFEIGKQDDELVAGMPADAVRFAHAGGQPGGHGFKQVVARGVSERVVDRLESVEVEKQQCQCTAKKNGVKSC